MDKSLIGEALENTGMTYADLGTALGISMGTVNSKMSGRSRFTYAQAEHLRREYGREGAALVEASEMMFRAIQSGSAEERRKVTAKGRAQLLEDDGVEVDYWPNADGTVTHYEDGEPGEWTIDEWKARFGMPGMAADQHGRMMGYFTTEPDYCED
jgi:transcriptional regulator with XRE-family HTH domain